MAQQFSTAAYPSQQGLIQAPKTAANGTWSTGLCQWCAEPGGCGLYITATELVQAFTAPAARAASMGKRWKSWVLRQHVATAAVGPAGSTVSWCLLVLGVCRSSLLVEKSGRCMACSLALEVTAWWHAAALYVVCVKRLERSTSGVVRSSSTTRNHQSRQLTCATDKNLPVQIKYIGKAGNRVTCIYVVLAGPVCSLLLH
ncbi:hypothetical protein ABBQ32_006643 [Trebouxia sp. C0010 RCD-2024]